MDRSMDAGKNDPVDEKAAAVMKAAAAKLDTNAAEFHFICAQHVGGLCVGGFTSYDAANSAANDHKRATGHTDCTAFGGNCPF